MESVEGAKQRAEAAADVPTEAEKRLLGKPQLTQTQAARLARKLYGVEKVDSMKEFPAYDDRNFYMKTEAGKEYVMKVTNAEDSKNSEEIEAQNAVMLHLAAAGVSCPRPVADKQGAFVSMAELPPDGDGDGDSAGMEPCQKRARAADSRNAVRLLTYLEGVVWDVVPQPPETLCAIGSFVGRVVTALETFRNRAAEARSHSWDLARVLEIEDLVQHFETPEQRDVVHGVLQRFRDDVLPRGAELPKGVIHGDINEQNLLMHPEKPEVTGLIDFGDMLNSWKINEIAITMAYGMLKKEDPVAAAGHLVAGYAKTRALSEAEWGVLPALVACRLAQSITIGNHAAMMHPSNKEYLLLTQKPGWDALQVLWNRDWKEVEAAWRAAAGSEQPGK